MKYCLTILTSLILIYSFTEAAEFSISSYNCGGLSAHYDYLRGVALQKVMRDRHIAEPEQMALNDKIQKLALKILFCEDSEEQMRAQAEWDRKDYGSLAERIMMPPTEPNSPNASWNKLSSDTITTYQIRPVVIYDNEVNEMLLDHVKDYMRIEEPDMMESLSAVRTIMGERIFAHHLKHDIICLQEADYLSSSMFPEGYEYMVSEGSSKNAIAWNKARFSLVEVVKEAGSRAFAVELLDRETQKTVLVASCHLTGCNPYKADINPATGVSDSAKGDAELKTAIECFEQREADIKLLGMDSNVTPLHPRMLIMKDAGYRMDSENYLDGTCTSPYTVLDTRIDWLVVKSSPDIKSNIKIVNIPVLGVGLNCVQTNMSDHKPVAAKVSF